MSKDAAPHGENGALQSALERYTAAAGRGHVAVAFAADSAVVTASALGPRDRRAPIGCIAKLFTAALVASAARRGRFALEASAGELLGAPRGVLSGVTARQLLEHTHGLDDSLLAPPRYARGFIDRAELLARVAALDRWALPGAVYSYGNGGAWLLAALLERLHGRRFAELVRAELFVGCTEPRDAALCAALGTGLRLTAEEIARFGLHALTSESVAGVPIAPLPGWHPLERGVCLGWKAAGAGWFGHQSAWPGASIFLRVQPNAKLALAVVAREQPAALVALGLFGARFPELFDGRARWPAAARAPLQPGVYAQAARVVAVAQTARGLCVQAWGRNARGEQLGSRTQAQLAQAGGVLFARPASERLPYLEPVGGERGSAWLWNGSAVLRRVDRRAPNA